MSGIRQKQINDLVFDISSLYTGSDVFNRDTTYTLGTPLEGQAQLDSSNAALATTLHIHTKDSTIGNRFETLEDFQKHDTLIIQTSTGAIAKYEIKSIQSAVDLSNEGHFILTIQHSFGYSSTFQNEKMSYYFRRSASDVLIENLKAEIQFLRTELESTMQVERIARAIGDTNLQTALDSKKAVIMASLTADVQTSVTHNLGTKNLIVQVQDSTGTVVTDVQLRNFNNSTIDVTARSTDTYKIIIIS